MGKLRVNAFSISLDGYGAGPRQSLEEPLGVGGEGLHDWFKETKTFRRMQGEVDGESGTNDDFAARSFENIGAWIMGRNMFGPVRGSWKNDGWKGWWGDNPPYHVPVFVLTHYAQDPIEMAGGTTFHFVTGGIEDALERARAAARDMDIRVGGGASTIRQYLEAGLIDEMHIAVAPVLLGSGEHLFGGIDLPSLGYQRTEHVATANATHFVIARA